MSPSVLLTQYSSTSFAVVDAVSSDTTCCSSSESVNPSKAASVVAHNLLTAKRSSSGGACWPRRRLDFCREIVELTDVVESFCGVVESPCLAFSIAFLRIDVLESSGLMEGNISFFCLDAGNISSRSTGTPRDTRKSRRIRDFTQFGGCSGGGATNWDHKESERSLLKMAVESGIASNGGNEGTAFVSGNRVSRESLVVDKRSDKDGVKVKSNSGGFLERVNNM